MCELLWSDPQPNTGRAASKRGVGIQFGPDVTHEFLRTNKLDYIIRSHEMKHNGYEVAHDNKCITVFSAPNYWLVKFYSRNELFIFSLRHLLVEYIHIIFMLQ